MKALAIKAAILVLVLAGILFLFIQCPWLESEPFQNIKKKHDILGGIAGKKVILIGGSGVANGLSAGIIEKNVPGYRAVNMGLNAGLGLRFNIREIMEYIRPGDVVILSPEYDNFEGEYKGAEQILKAINIAPFASKYIERDQYVELLKKESWPFIQVKAESYLDGFARIFTGLGAVLIDERGDRVNNSASRDVSKIPFSFKMVPESYRECVAILNQFDQYCKKRGAIAALSFPSIPGVQYRHSQKEIDTLYQRLMMDTSMLILHQPDAAVYDPVLFDDTVYHLGKRGRELRSLKIAGLITTKVLNREVGR